MIDWPTICKCHQIVPVQYWPVLWFYLACLRLTLDEAWADGCDGLVWSLKPTGVIYIKYCGETAAERAARANLSPAFDRAPWTRLAPPDLGALSALFSGAPDIGPQPACFRPVIERLSASFWPPSTASPLAPGPAP